MSDVHVVIAVKGLERGKDRLAHVLTVAERHRLIMTMLDDVLETLGATAGLGSISVLTRDRALLPAGVHHIDDQGFGLNAAVAHAARSLAESGARAMLVLPADLPFVTSPDIDALLAAAKHHDAVIAPDAQRSGTNALLLSPPELIQPSFGVHSFTTHVESIRSAQAFARLHSSPPSTSSLQIVDRPGLACDIDAPADLPALLGKPGGRYQFLDAALRKAS